jgi:hypothetical protein
MTENPDSDGNEGEKRLRSESELPLPPAYHERDRLSRKPGDGAKSAQADTNDAVTFTRYSDSHRTRFSISDADGYGDVDYKRWQRLKEWHHGTQNNWDGEMMEGHISQSLRYHYSDKKRLAGALCDSACLNSRERELVVSLSSVIEYYKLGAYSSLEKGILGLIAAVTSSSRSGYPHQITESPEYHLEMATIWRQEQFQKLMEEFELDKQGLDTIRQNVYNQVPSLRDLGPDTS